MPKGVRHGEERHVVHSLSLEKSLSEIHRLIRPPRRRSARRAAPRPEPQRGGRFHRGGGDASSFPFFGGVVSAASSRPAKGLRLLLFKHSVNTQTV